MKQLYFFVLIASFVFIPAAPTVALPQKRIPAKAAVLMDSSGAVLFAKYADTRLAPASTVKLVTAMVAMDRLDPAQKVKISRAASRARTVQLKLHPGEEFTVSDLLHLALIQSVNSAAVALAEATAGSEQAFAVLMNRKASELGAHNTLFTNASGLPKGTQYTTASDLTVILKAALTYPLIKEILGKRGCLVRTTGGREIIAQTSNNLFWRTEGVIGGKTGYTGDARHCFVCAVNTEKGPLYLAVLGARSRSSLWKSALLLAELGMGPESPDFKDYSRLAVRENTIVVK